MSKIGTDLDWAIELLKNEKLVAIPTETVYGLAANALSKKAVAKIFEVKNRPSFDPLIVHTHSLEAVAHLVKDIPAPLLQLSQKFMPGPLSILLEKKASLPDLVTAGLPKVAVRIPNQRLTLDLLSQLDFPLAAPSANPFGYISPTCSQHVEEQLGQKIEYILDGGNCQIGLESTVVDWQDGQVCVLRKGGVTIEALEKVVGPVKVNMHSSSNPTSPGMLKSHYAPRRPMTLESLEVVRTKFRDDRIGFLAFHKRQSMLPSKNQKILSGNRDLNEAAQNLFSMMRELDKMDVDIIVAEVLPEEGLGRAINDKLKRASA